MVWLCLILSAFAGGMFYWNRVLRSYAGQSIHWMEDVKGQIGEDPDWADELADIDESIEVGMVVGTSTMARAIPYSLILCFAVIITVLIMMGVDNKVMTFILVVGIPSLVVDGINSYRQFKGLEAEVLAVGVVLQAKINYDTQIAIEKLEPSDDDA